MLSRCKIVFKFSLVFAFVLTNIAWSSAFAGESKVNFAATEAGQFEVMLAHSTVSAEQQANALSLQASSSKSSYLRGYCLDCSPCSRDGDCAIGDCYPVTLCLTTPMPES